MVLYRRIWAKLTPIVFFFCWGAGGFFFPPFFLLSTIVFEERTLLSSFFPPSTLFHRLAGPAPFSFCSVIRRVPQSTFPHRHQNEISNQVFFPFVRGSEHSLSPLSSTYPPPPPETTFVAQCSYQAFFPFREEIMTAVFLFSSKGSCLMLFREQFLRASSPFFFFCE